MATWPTITDDDGTGLIGTVLAKAIFDAIKAYVDTYLGADGIAGRIPRGIILRIDNGTNAATLKCTVTSLWNGDTIAETDNIAKDATTGHFTLDAAGDSLKVEAAGLSGNVLYALGVIGYNVCGTLLGNRVSPNANDILFDAYNMPDGGAKDLTTLVDTGRIDIYILYITDA